MTKDILVVSGITFVVILGVLFSIWSSGGTFGQRCSAKFDNKDDIAYCVDMLVNGKMKLYEIESKGWLNK